MALEAWRAQAHAVQNVSALHGMGVPVEIVYVALLVTCIQKHPFGEATREHTMYTCIYRAARSLAAWRSRPGGLTALALEFWLVKKVVDRCRYEPAGVCNNIAHRLSEVR